MRSKFGGKGDEEEDEDELDKKEMEDNDRRAKHSIEGILGDRCEWAARVIAPDVEQNSWHLAVAGVIFFISVATHTLEPSGALLHQIPSHWVHMGRFEISYSITKLSIWAELWETGKVKT